MKTSSSIFTLAVSSVALFASGSVESADMGGVDIGIRPRFEVGVMNYTFEQGAIGSSLQTSNLSGNFTQSSIKYQDSMPLFGGGLTLFVDRFYFDLSAYKAVNGKDSDTINFSEYVRDLSTSSTAFINGNPINSGADFDRNEYSVTIGYSINDQLSILGGYKWAKTDFDLKISGPFTLAGQIPPNSPQAFEGTYSGSVNNKFEYDGPYIGVIYGLGLGEGSYKGTLSFNAAVAFLNGKVKHNGDAQFIINGKVYNASDYYGDSVPYGASFNSSGDTVGLTFGVTWRGLTPVKNLTYSLGINGYKYDFSADSSLQPDITETVFNLKAGVEYTF